MMRRILGACVVGLTLLGCGASTKSEPSAKSGVADGSTWCTIADQGARMKIPSGWSWTHEGDAFVARPTDDKAAIVFAGATTKEQLEARVRSIGDGFRLDEVDFQKKGRKANLHGIPVAVFEDMAAETSGTPADVLVMLGDAPSGRGVVMVFVMAWDTSQAHDLAIIDAANSLSPM